MISLIMPYWNRIDLLTRSLESLTYCYGSDINFEVVIVDDGSMDEPCVVEGLHPYPITIFTLPKKEVALNPCLPLNKAVEVCRGEVLIITNPEIIHITPIIQKMLYRLAETGMKAYVAAATWSVDKKKWYCHSEEERTLGRWPVPDGAGLHFCAMMWKNFFLEIGGFSEEYRDGQAFEDNDFLWKLHEAEANFSILDDCIVNHHGTSTKWPSGGLKRNQAIFERKWKHVL